VVLCLVLLRLEALLRSYFCPCFKLRLLTALWNFPFGVFVLCLLLFFFLLRGTSLILKRSRQEWGCRATTPSWLHMVAWGLETTLTLHHRLQLLFICSLISERWRDPQVQNWTPEGCSGLPGNSKLPATWVTLCSCLLLITCWSRAVWGDPACSLWRCTQWTAKVKAASPVVQSWRELVRDTCLYLSYAGSGPARFHSFLTRWELGSDGSCSVMFTVLWW